MELIKGLLSVIIPVYNVAPYLTKCLDSVLSQTYRNLEIIIVDDGSTDDSKRICDEYQKENKQIVTFHVEHGGTSRARNLGLHYARGEYIGFVDGDDYLDLDMYEDMLLEMEDSTVDIVTCGRYVSFPDEKHMRDRLGYSSAKRIRINNQEAIEELLKCIRFSFSVCDKVFRRKLFDNVIFPEGRTCEDVPVTYMLFKKSRNIVHCGKPKYHNYHRENSSSRHDFYYRRVDQALFAGAICKDVRTAYPCLKKRAEAMYVEHLVCTIQCIKNCGHRHKYRQIERRLVGALRHMSIWILSNPNITQERKWEYLSEIISVY